jgi:hypothetical protein
VFLREEVAPKDFSLETWAQRIETDQRAAIGAQRGDYGADRPAVNFASEPRFTANAIRSHWL